MSLFENFPYTNFHNLNLDWIIKVLKNAVSELEDIQTNWETVRDTATDAKNAADVATTKAENARITANGAMTKAINAENKANTAATQAENALASSQEAVVLARDAKNVADGINDKADNALQNSQTAVENAKIAANAANAANTKSSANEEAIKDIDARCDDAISLAESNETNIVNLNGDVTRLNTAIVNGLPKNVYSFNFPGRSSYPLSTATIDRGHMTIKFDFSEDIETLSFFDAYKDSMWTLVMVSYNCIADTGYSIDSENRCGVIIHNYPSSIRQYMIVTFMLPPGLSGGAQSLYLGSITASYIPRMTA